MTKQLEDAAKKALDILNSMTRGCVTSAGFNEVIEAVQELTEALAPPKPVEYLHFRLTLFRGSTVVAEQNYPLDRSMNFIEMNFNSIGGPIICNDLALWGYKLSADVRSLDPSVTG